MNAPRDQDVISALRLRRWALPLLSLPPEPAAADQWRAAPPAGAEAWRLFLTAERCTLPLDRRLPLTGDPLPPAALAVLRQGARAESIRVLGVQSQLGRLGAMAAEHGWLLVVLKSGASLAQGWEPLDLVDLDVLVPAEATSAVQATLLGAGYRKVSSDTDQHLGGFLWEATANVEVHFALRALAGYPGAVERSLPAPADGRLRVLEPVDHAWHVLHHGVRAHPERRGSLRDLMLLACSIRGLGPAQLDALRARALGDSALAAVYERMLEQGIRMARGEPGADHFAVESACRLMGVRGEAERGLDRPMRNTVDRATFGFASRRGALRDGVRHAFARGEGMVAAFRNVYPPLGRTASGASRLALFTVALPFAGMRVAHARRLVRDSAGRADARADGEA